MPLAWKERLVRALRWSERYTKTDMVYFASGNFWLTLSRGLSILSGFGLTLAFANLISAQTFGTYKYVIAIASFVGAFSLGGLGGAVGRAIAQGNKHVVPGAFRAAFVWSLPASTLALLASGYYLWQGNSILSIGLLLIALTNPFSNGFVIYKNVFLGAKDFKAFAIYGIPRSMVPILVVLATLLLTDSLAAILLAYFISNLAVGATIYLAALRKYRIEGRKEGVAETVAYGKHLSVMGAVSQMTGSIDQLLLWFFSGPVALATYTFALAPIREIRNISENVHPLVFPKYVNKSVEEIKKTMRLRVLQLLGVSAAIAVLYIALAPLLFKLAFPQYVSATILSQILALGLLLQPKTIMETVLYSQGDTKLRYVTVFVTQGAKVISWATLIPFYGVAGAVAGTIISDIVSAGTLWWAYRKLK